MCLGAEPRAATLRPRVSCPRPLTDVTEEVTMHHIPTQQYQLLCIPHTIIKLGNVKHFRSHFISSIVRGVRG